MAQRTENDLGTGLVSPLVMVDSDTEVLGTLTLAGNLTVSEAVTLDTDALIKRIDVTLDCSADETAEALAVGTVPIGSVILGVVATVVTAFDGTTDTFEVGITGNTDKYIDPLDLDTDGAVGTTIFSATGTNNDQKVLEYATAAIPIIATYTNTGGTVTAGSVRVQVLYV